MAAVITRLGAAARPCCCWALQAASAAGNGDDTGVLALAGTAFGGGIDSESAERLGADPDALGLNGSRTAA